jgi:glycine/D-amino acid oxidase-like deaminating enzyme
MANPNGYSDFVQDIKSLLAAAEANSALLAHLEDERVGLQKHLEELEIVKTRQQAAVGERRKSTQELNALLAKGRGLVIHYRNGVKAALGYKNELLAQFGIAPFRKRVRRAKPAETEPPVPEVTTAKK